MHHDHDDDDSTTKPATTAATATPPKHPAVVLAEQRGGTVKEATFLIEQMQTVEALRAPIKDVNYLRSLTSSSKLPAAQAALDKALSHPYVPSDLANELRRCGRDGEAMLITLDYWIKAHWDALLRVLGVLVGKPGAVVAVFPHELLLPYAKALDYAVKSGHLALGDVVLALKPVP